MADSDKSATRAKPGRKPRFSSEELKERTLAAALEAVLRAGVTGGLDAIRIERVIVDADVPRGATYELWDSRGAGTSQENLRRATVIEVIRNMPAGNVQRTRDYALAAIEAKSDILAVGDAAAIRAVRAELIRDVTGFNFKLLQDQRWRVYKTLASSIGTQQDDELREALGHGEDALLRSYGELFDQLAAIFQLKLRPEYEMKHFVMSTYALNEGLSNRVGSTFADQTVVRDGTDWTVFAIGFEALVDHYFVGS